MILRRRPASLLLLAALTAVLQGAPVPPLPTDPKAPAPAPTFPPRPKLSDPAPAPAKPEDESPKSAALADAAPNSGTTTTAAPAIAPAGTTGAAGATTASKPGIFSAMKAKGPPPTAKASAAPAPLPAKLKLVRDHIGALFDLRSAPPAPLNPRDNPFRPPGAVPVAPLPPSPVAGGSTPAPAPPPTTVEDDRTLLQQAVAALKLKGHMEVGKSKTLQIVINSGPGNEGTYKEGDIVNVALPKGDPVHLRVRHLTAHSITLALNQAETTLKF